MQGALSLLFAAAAVVAALICADGAHGGSQGAPGLDGLAVIFAGLIGGLGGAIGLLGAAVRMFEAPQRSQGTAALLAVATALGAMIGIPMLVADHTRQGSLRRIEQICAEDAPVTLPATLSTGIAQREEGVDQPYGQISLSTAHHTLRARLDERPPPDQDQFTWSLNRVGELEGEAWTFDAGALDPSLGHLWEDSGPFALVSMGDELAWAFTSMAAVRLSLADRQARVETMAPGVEGRGSGRFWSTSLQLSHAVPLDSDRLAFFSPDGPVILSRDALVLFPMPAYDTRFRHFDDHVRVTPEHACWIADAGGTSTEHWGVLLSRGADPNPGALALARAAFGGGLISAGLGALALLVALALSALAWRSRDEAMATRRVALAWVALGGLGWTVAALSYG